MDIGFPTVVWGALFGLGFAVTPPFLAWFWDVCGWARALTTPPILAGVGPPFLAGVFGCVGWCACFSCTLPIMAGVCGASVSVRVFAFTPQICAGVLGHACFGARSSCNSPFLAGVCGVGVCAWARVLAGPRHFWLGYWGVCVCVHALPVPRQSWLRCALCVCVLGLEFRLGPAITG